MPQYLAPGVYVEEVSFRPKTIEGVGTTTAGFIGPARYGPISGAPPLLTSFADFERIYGGLDDLKFSGGGKVNYLAHAVRSFFAEGGTKLHVCRVFNEEGDNFGLTGSTEIPTKHYGTASRNETASSDMDFQLVARFPGAAGNMRVIFTMEVGNNAFISSSSRLTRVSRYDLVHISNISGNNRSNKGSGDGLFIADHDQATGDWKFVDSADASVSDISIGDLGANDEVRPINLRAEAAPPRKTSDSFYPAESFGEFQPDPRSGMALTARFTRNPAIRRDSLTVPFALDDLNAPENEAALTIIRGVFDGKLGDLTKENPTIRAKFTFEGGDDGAQPTSTYYKGDAANFVDYLGIPDALSKNGLLALAGIDEISMVAAPGHTDLDSEDDAHTVKNSVINHCEELRYRMAILDTPPNLLVGGAQTYRNERSSEYAAMYYPWIYVADPRPGRGGQQLKLPPSGFMAGIYARSDTENAVFKAPANEVVRTALDFEQHITKPQQEILNPQGVNCLRFFEGRGYMVWGARTISDDPEWKYLNLRRYFNYLEFSIDRGTQWAVFENNSADLWEKVRRTIENFLFNEWRRGGLMGAKPEQAYFVRCDRTTMTQNDIDNGRLICLIGVAAVRPAEFVIFRIGQWTAGGNQ